MICGFLSPDSVPGVGASELAVMCLSMLYLKQLAELVSFSIKQSASGKVEKTNCYKRILPVDFSVLIWGEQSVKTALGLASVPAVWEQMEWA